MKKIMSEFDKFGCLHTVDVLVSSKMSDSQIAAEFKLAEIRLKESIDARNKKYLSTDKVRDFINSLYEPDHTTSLTHMAITQAKKIFGDEFKKELGL